SARELGLGPITLGDWWRVLRHEICMGVLLRLALGVIGFFRGASTSEDLRSAKREMEEAIQVAVPEGQELQVDSDGRYLIPEGTRLAISEPVKLRTLIAPPAGVKPQETASEGERIYKFP